MFNGVLLNNQAVKDKELNIDKNQLLIDTTNLSRKKSIKNISPEQKKIMDKIFQFRDDTLNTSEQKDNIKNKNKPKL